MRKIYLFMLAMICSMITSAQSQVFYDDFEDNNLEGYTLYNLDGLTPDDPDLDNMTDSAWTVRLISSQGWESGLSAFSVSWYENDEGPSNDWLITPAIEIGSGAMLEWDAMAITSSGNFRDRYQVFIGPSADLADYEVLAPVFDTQDTGEVAFPIHRMIDLAALGFENETIHIAFRNTTQGYNPDLPTGPGNGGNELAIDNIEVSTVLSLANREITSEFAIQPNPSSGDFQIAFTLLQDEEIFLDIIDITGKLVESHTLGHRSQGSFQERISRGSIPAGLYLIRLRSENGISVTKANFY